MACTTPVADAVSGTTWVTFDVTARTALRPLTEMTPNSPSAVGVLDGTCVDVRVPSS